MTKRDQIQTEVGPLQLEAIDWVVRLGLSRGSAEDERALNRWRAQSQDHEDAWRRASGFADELRALPLPGVRDGRVTALPQRRPHLDRRAVIFGGGGALAASIAAGIIVTEPPGGLWPSWAEMTAQHRTGPGQSASFSPTAGVKVELNTRTSLSVTNDGRGIELIRGETFLSIDDRPKPFLVHTADRFVSARSGAFSVRMGGADLCITCESGDLSVLGAGGVIPLSAGQQITINGSGTIARAQVDPNLTLAWRRGLLIFHGAPLATAINEINRYFPGRLILMDKAIAGQPINGVFHINQIKYAVVQIEQLAGVSATRLPAGVVLLG